MLTITVLETGKSMNIIGVRHGKIRTDTIKQENWNVIEIIQLQMGCEIETDQTLATRLGGWGWQSWSKTDPYPHRERF